MKTQVTVRIFKLSLIHVSVIYQFPWIRWNVKRAFICGFGSICNAFYLYRATSVDLSSAPPYEHAWRSNGCGFATNLSVPWGVLVFLNFGKKIQFQILWSLSSVDFHTLTLQLPIQTQISVASGPQVFVSSLKMSAKRAHPLISKWKLYKTICSYIFIYNWYHWYILISHRRA